jgi:hypothetical protein
MSTYDKPYLSFPQQLQPLKARGAAFMKTLPLGKAKELKYIHDATTHSIDEFRRIE